MKAWVTFSSKTTDKNHIQLAHDVAELLICKKNEILCGGTNGLMMEQIQSVCKEHNQGYTCVTLECYHEDLSDVEEKYIVSSTFERTKKLYDMADVIVFLPGGTGSLTEIFAALEEYRTLPVKKKMILYNDQGFYNPVLAIIEDFIKRGLNDKDILKNFTIVNNLEELKKKVSEEDE